MPPTMRATVRSTLITALTKHGSFSHSPRACCWHTRGNKAHKARPHSLRGQRRSVDTTPLRRAAFPILCVRGRRSACRRNASSSINFQSCRTCCAVGSSSPCARPPAPTQRCARCPRASHEGMTPHATKPSGKRCRLAWEVCRSTMHLMPGRSPQCSADSGTAPGSVAGRAASDASPRARLRAQCWRAVQAGLPLPNVAHVVGGGAPTPARRRRAGALAVWLADARDAYSQHTLLWAPGSSPGGPIVERAWVRLAREAMGADGQVVPQQWLAKTSRSSGWPTPPPSMSERGTGASPHSRIRETRSPAQPLTEPFCGS